jgi:uncharacterized membrane protein
MLAANNQMMPAIIRSRILPAPIWTTAAALVALSTASAPAAETTETLERRFSQVVQPLLKSHCFECHAGDKQEAKLNLADFDSARSLAENPRTWHLIRLRLEVDEMPPEDAKTPLSADDRRALTDWIKEAQAFEAERSAGDPGPVLARRLSNAEFDY